MFEQQRLKFRVYHDNTAYFRTRAIAPNLAMARGWSGRASGNLKLGGGATTFVPALNGPGLSQRDKLYLNGAPHRRRAVGKTSEKSAHSPVRGRSKRRRPDQLHFREPPGYRTLLRPGWARSGPIGQETGGRGQRAAGKFASKGVRAVAGYERQALNCRASFALQHFTELLYGA